MSESQSLEIERVWLLKQCPALPSAAKRLKIHQGYLRSPSAGRLRMTTDANGARSFLHTIKTGEGLVRREVEQSLSEASFKAAWPQTEGQRLTKTRWCVQEGELTWEIDVFDEIDLVLAEVELPSTQTPAEPPAWLKGCIEREVTEEPAYRNFAIVGRHLTTGQSEPWIG